MAAIPMEIQLKLSDEVVDFFNAIMERLDKFQERIEALEAEKEIDVLEKPTPKPEYGGGSL